MSARSLPRTPSGRALLTDLAIASAFFAVILDASIVGQQPPAFRVETRLVVLHATVTNSHGELVTNLNSRAFSVYENGRRQRITLFRRDDVPVSLGLLIDNSGSMRSLRMKVEAAALAFVRASNPLDEVFVVNFADKARVDVPLTSDLSVLEAGIARVDSIGGTALRDAVILAERYVRQHASRDRKVLLIITDGNDNASTASLEQLRRTAAETETAVFAVGLFREAGSTVARRGWHTLEELTEQTGGVAYCPTSVDRIDAVVLDIARVIRNQYTIAYAPIDQALDGAYRAIRVKVDGPGRLSVKTRAGYWATPNRSGMRRP
jgi:Ca-activated chloride channel homolog